MNCVKIFEKNYYESDEKDYHEYCEKRRLTEVKHCPYCEEKVLFINICDIHDRNDHHTVLQCPNCRNISVQKWYDCGLNDEIYDGDMFLFPHIPKKRKFDNIIVNISSFFCEIYNQAEAAEAYGLNQIAGIGYRKAMEFLIKDYAKIKFPDKEESIKKKSLAACIESYVLEPRLKAMAKGAIWLGNDETHYERKWVDKDINDLKTLIDLTLHWINYETLTEQYKESMNISD